MDGSIVVIGGRRVLRVDPVTGDRALLAANVEIPFEDASRMDIRR